MSVTAIVAIYAALVSTGLLVVALANLRSGRTRVKLMVNPGTGDIGSEDYDQPAPQGEVVFFQITNRSAHPIKIESLGAILPKAAGGGGYVSIRPFPTNLQLPFEIPARDNRTLWITREGLNTSWPLRFFVKSTAGESFETKALMLDKEPRWSLHTPTQFRRSRFTSDVGRSDAVSQTSETPS